MLRRDKQYLEALFHKHKHPDTGCLTIEQLSTVLDELAFEPLSESEMISTAFESNLQRVEGVLSLDQFQYFMLNHQRQGPIELWAQGLPLAQLVSDSFPILKGVEPLVMVSTLSSNEIEAVSAVFQQGFKKTLTKYIKELKEGLSATEQVKAVRSQNYSQSKYSSISTMACGDISAFFEGLGTRVGKK